MRDLIAATTLALCALAAFAPSVAEAKPKKPKKGPPLVVKRIRPKHGQTLVDIGSNVTVTFSRPVARDAVTPATFEFKKLSGGAVPIGISFDKSDKVVVLTPLAPLEGSTDYTVVVHAGIPAATNAERTLKRDKYVIFFTQLRKPPPQLLRQEQFQVLAGQMSEGRAFHTATLLGDGRVLLAGGMIDYVNFAAAGDLFDPTDDKFHATFEQLNRPRWGHAAVRLGFEVMLVGGSDASGPIAATEEFDPASRTFRVGPSLLEARDLAPAVRLGDGRVLVCGGLYYVGGRPFYSRTAEILDPLGQSFRASKGQPLNPRAGHTATLLPDGRVLLVGGDSQSLPPVLEVFDPVTETFSVVPGLTLERRSGHTATLLESGIVLIDGGGPRSPQVFDPGNLSLRSLGGSAVLTRIGATATPVGVGDVLIAGGLLPVGQEKFALASMDIIETDGIGDVLQAGVQFPEPRYGHTATTLYDGRTLFVGGVGVATEQSLVTGVLLVPDQP